jgi:putative endonuclease
MRTAAEQTADQTAQRTADNAAIGSTGTASVGAVGDRDRARQPRHALGGDLGRAAEQLAVAHLESQRLVILSRNWRCRAGELDVVATDGRRLIVVEVKARSSGAFGDPAQAVTPQKMVRIRAATNAWLRKYQMRWCPVRFDVVSVLWPASGSPRLQHLTGAF